MRKRSQRTNGIVYPLSAERHTIYNAWRGRRAGGPASKERTALSIIIILGQSRMYTLDFAYRSNRGKSRIVTESRLLCTSRTINKMKTFFEIPKNRRPSDHFIYIYIYVFCAPVIVLFCVWCYLTVFKLPIAPHPFWCCEAIGRRQTHTHTHSRSGGQQCMSPKI